MFPLTMPHIGEDAGHPLPKGGGAMAFSRRDFLKGGVGTGAAAAAVGLGLDLRPVKAYAQTLKIKTAKAVPSICYYCAVGCGIISWVEGGKVVQIEGDPDHPVNRGTLCSKAQAFAQAISNERRLTKVLYRAPGATAWETKPLDWAMDQIARRIRATRDATFEEQEDGVTVNRTRALASLGGAILSNEECYLLVKLMRGLGVVYLEHQARI